MPTELPGAPSVGGAWTWGAALLGILLLARPAQAQARSLSVEEMTRRCAVIGVATVTSGSASRDPENGLINTTYLLEFTELWKGTVSGQLPLVQAGGQLGNEACRVVGGQVLLHSGESIVVFATPRALGGFHVIGLRQGLYRVTPGSPPRVLRDGETPRAGAPLCPLGEFRDEVYRALGKPVENRELRVSPKEIDASGPTAPASGGREEGSGGEPARGTSPSPSESPPWIGIVGASILVLSIVWIVRRGITRV